MTLASAFDQLASYISTRMSVLLFVLLLQISPRMIAAAVLMSTLEGETLVSNFQKTEQGPMMALIFTS